jgi:ABC-type nickel/cobalt efflux system permease component RcnA
MKNIISMIVVAALAAVGVAEAKPEVRPEKPVCPIEMKHGKHRCHKHHVRPHRHGKRHMRKPIIIRKGKHVCSRCGEKHAPGKQPRMMKK